MTRIAQPALVAGCLLTLTLVCFWPVLARDGQFALRDSAEFYYPLHLRVEREWDAGRWPLWEPEENGGTPLLGNPSAAVLYPGKLLFRLPEPWGARLYVVAHVVIAFVAMRMLLRSWKLSPTGGTLGAAAYAFGAPVLFQYANVIFLVGAAWTPLGFRAVDRGVRLRRPGALRELALVLALQILGGDPETAYLLLVCGLCYALGLAWNETRRDGQPPIRGLRWRLTLAGLAWIVGVLGAAVVLKRLRLQGTAVDQVWSWATHPGLLLAAWLCAAGMPRLRARAAPAANGVAMLAGAALLAAALAAVQLVPVLEFLGVSTRDAQSASHEIDPFSVEPVRGVEFLWPGFFGVASELPGQWLHLVPPRHLTQQWTPSLYLGGLTLILALGAAGFRNGPPWRGWLTAVAVVSLAGALGVFGGPLWWVRALVPDATPLLGAHNPTVYDPPRADGGLADGAGGIYWLMAAVLPGFRAFRYPGKLLTFSALAISALAAHGWDLGFPPRARRWALRALAVSVVGLTLATLFSGQLRDALHAQAAGVSATPFSPFDPASAVRRIQFALAHGAIVMACIVGLGMRVHLRPAWAGPAAVILMTADLAIAGTALIVTVPQAVFDTPSRVAQLIQQAETADPSPGPFRVHRMPPWYPLGQPTSPALPDLGAMIEWERQTLRPKYGLLDGLSYTLAPATLDREDYSLYFASFTSPLDTDQVTLFNASHGQPVRSYTRRGFDLWNTRYFVLPLEPGNWQDPARGFLSFLTERRMIAPDPLLLENPDRRAELDDWLTHHDWQLLRNTAAFPRAWIVHQARFHKPLPEGESEEKSRVFLEMLYEPTPFWTLPGRRVFDPHMVAWIESDAPRSLARFTPRTPVGADESVEIARYEPQRVEIEARLNRPGFVVLADAHYPGWSLTIDGRPAPILRANGLMRGAAVEAGSHRLIYTYNPLSFRLGAALTLLALAFLPILAIVARQRTRRLDGHEPRENLYSLEKT